MTQLDRHFAPLWLLVLLQGAISACSLIVEIVAGRMVAPYVGMSLYTWTAIIAVVLAGFSLGHWWGGRIAAGASNRGLRATGWAMLAAGFSTAGAGYLLSSFAGGLLQVMGHPMLGITAITTLAFFLPSVFAGIPAPVLTVVAMRGRPEAERALGVMFATGAVGAIAGTVLAGFAFVPFFGSITTLAVVALAYLVSAIVCFWLGGAGRPDLRQGTAILGLLAALGASHWLQRSPCDRESAYYCIRTVALADDPGDRVHLMVIDHLAHGISGQSDPYLMFTDHAAMLDVLPRLRMGGADFTSFHIGGGSYSVPRAWAARGQGAITVAEIDPVVTQLAEQQFWLQPGLMRILHQDARVLLQNDPTRYDVIVGDAFTDIAVPEHLVTQEFLQLVAVRLNPGGIYAMNFIDTPARMQALAAMVATLRSVFPSVEIWTEATPPAPQERRIFVLLASAEDSPFSSITTRSPDPIRFQPLGQAFVDQLLARHSPKVFTDDHAPLAYLMGFEQGAF